VALIGVRELPRLANRVLADAPAFGLGPDDLPVVNLLVATLPWDLPAQVVERADLLDCGIHLCTSGSRHGHNPVRELLAPPRGISLRPRGHARPFQLTRPDMWRQGPAHLPRCAVDLGGAGREGYPAPASRPSLALE